MGRVMFDVEVGSGEGLDDVERGGGGRDRYEERLYDSPKGNKFEIGVRGSHFLFVVDRRK